MAASLESRALTAINRCGALLVYPIDNRRQPPSLWFELYPRTEMRWAWDEGADDRVVGLWHLRTELARSRAVVYGKWYKNRAVFFSKDLFFEMLVRLAPWTRALSREAREILELLEENSPVSTKALREAAGLRGRQSERAWTSAMRELFESLLVVGTGEVEDGSFPSLEVGATRWIFEKAWDEATNVVASGVVDRDAELFPADSAFGKHWKKTLASRER